jgi:hypothetical protein
MGEAERGAAAATCREGGGELRGEGGGLARRVGLARPQAGAEEGGCAAQVAEPTPKTADVTVAAAAVEEAAAAVAAAAAAMAGLCCHVVVCAPPPYGSPDGSPYDSPYDSP